MTSGSSAGHNSDAPVTPTRVTTASTSAVTVATRLPVGLATHGWGDTTIALPEGRWADLLTGREHAGDALASELMADHPAALLIREEGP